MCCEFAGRPACGSNDGDRVSCVSALQPGCSAVWIMASGGKVGSGGCPTAGHAPILCLDGVS